VDHADFMRLAIDQSRRGLAAGQSPFGAVIVRGDRVVAAGHNEVWLRRDPTAHAEIVTIQRAAAALKTPDLSGCVIYSTTEPCPMCAAAIHWSRLDAVHFGAAIRIAQDAGFNELTVPIEELYSRGGSRTAIHRGLLATECAALFDEWRARPDHRPY
jgi:tRNA(Arg) A34 adenosine deaminase TadA